MNQKGTNFSLSPAGLNTQFEYFFRDVSGVRKFYDKRELKKNMTNAVNADGLEVLGFSAYHFPKKRLWLFSETKGITAFAVLNYSDMNIHTSEEFRSVEGRIYSCKNAQSGMLAEKIFAKIYQPDLVILRRNIVVIDSEYLIDPSRDGMDDLGQRVIRYKGNEDVFDVSDKEKMTLFNDLETSIKRGLNK